MMTLNKNPGTDPMIPKLWVEHGSDRTQIAPVLSDTCIKYNQPPGELLNIPGSDGVWLKEICSLNLTLNFTYRIFYINSYWQRKNNLWIYGFYTLLYLPNFPLFPTYLAHSTPTTHSQPIYKFIIIHVASTLYKHWTINSTHWWSIHYRGSTILT